MKSTHKPSLTSKTSNHSIKRITLTQENPTSGPAELYELLAIDAVYTELGARLTEIPEAHDDLVMQAVTLAARIACTLADVPTDWNHVINSLLRKDQPR